MNDTPSVSSMINRAIGKQKIVHVWKEHFKQLLNTTGSGGTSKCVLNPVIDNGMRHQMMLKRLLKI